MRTQELHDFRDPMVTDAPNAGLSETEDRRPRLPAELSHLGEDIPEGTNYVVLGWFNFFFSAQHL